MGNTQQGNKQQLQDLYVADNKNIKDFDNALFGHDIVKKYLEHLEFQGQYEAHSEELKSENALKEKQTNTDLVLSLTHGETRQQWMKRKARYTKKIVGGLTQQHPSSFETVLKYRCQVMDSLFASVIRAELRNEVMKRVPSFVPSQMGKVLLDSTFSSSAYDSIRMRVTQELQIDIDCVLPLEQPTWDATGEIPPDDGSQVAKEKEVTTEQFQDHVLNLIIKTLRDEALTELKCNKQSPEPNVSPLLRLLQKIQLIILKDSLYDSKSRKAKMHYTLLRCYTVALLQSTLELLRVAREVSSQKSFDGVVQMVLSNSLLHHLLLPLATALCLVFDKFPRLSALASELLQPLHDILLELDLFNQISNELQNAELNCLETDRTSPWKKTATVLETPHPYFPNTNEERVVNIPGATHLIITFDPQCSTEKRHVLQIYAGPIVAEEFKILSPFSGRPENWPQIPIVVYGDTALFHFKTDPYQTYWGWKCVVKGVTLKPSDSWFYDFEATCTALMARCLDSVIQGSDQSEEEKKNASFLDSDILAAGRDEFKDPIQSEFIDHLIHNKPDTTASRFLENVLRRLPRSGTDKVGNESTDIGFRATAAALLKHMNLIGDVLNEKRTPDLDRQIPDIFKEAKKVREWMIQQRHEAENKEEAEKEKELNSTAMATTSALSSSSSSSLLEDKTRHEYWGENVLGKAKFLLDLVPASTISANHLTHFIQNLESSRALSRVIDVRKTRVQARSKGFLCLHNLLQKLSFITVKRTLLKILGRSLRTAGGHYLSGTKSCGPDNQAQVKNAFYELYNLLQNLLMQEETDEYIKNFIVDSFCIDFLPDDHDFLLRTKVVEYLHTFSDNSEKSLALSATQDKTVNLKQMAFHFMCVNSTVPVNVVTPKITNSLSTSTASLSLSSPNSTSISPHSEAQFQTPLQQSIVQMLWSDINSGLQVLELQRAHLSTSTEGKRSTIYHEKEKMLFCSLVLYFATAMTSEEKTKKELEGKGAVIVKMCLSILRLGTPRLQCLVLRMFRLAILPNVPPSLLADPNVLPALFSSDPSNTTTTKDSFIGYLFGIVGTALLVDNTTSNAKHDSKNYRTGQIVLSVAGEVVNTLRSLLSKTSISPISSVQNTGSEPTTLPPSSFYAAHWSKVLVEEISLALSEIPSLVDVQSSKMRENIDIEKTNKALAALAVIGGYTERLRPGARVMKFSLDKKNTECGLLVEYDRLSGLARVLFDSNGSKVIEFDPEKLVPLVEVSVDLASFPLTSSTLEMFMSFTQGPRAEPPKLTMKPLEALPEEPEGTMDIEKETPPATPEKSNAEEPVEWSCPQCTLINQKSASFCTICGASKPSVSAISPTSSGPWTCPVCTFFNSTNTPTCGVCNQANPSNATPSPPPTGDWQCPSCTLFNSISSQYCVICNVPRPGSGNSDSLNREKGDTLMEIEQPESKEEPAEETETENDDPNMEPLFFQFRSRALKAFCLSLQDPNSARVVIGKKLLPNLFSLALSPTRLETFMSIEKLETHEDLLLELLYDYKWNFISETNLTSSARSTKILKYSPFAALPVQIPSALDRESAQRVTFYDGNFYTVEGRATDPFNIGIVRANFAVPGSLPSFYFEMRILPSFRGRNEGDDLVGIGFMRDGMTLEGLPGHYSFVYTSDGELCNSSGTDIIKRTYEEPFGVGDVIGCLLDSENKMISFTKNGRILGPAFQGVNTRVCPAVWLVTRGSRVCVNFGHEPWAFDFAKTLRPSYLKELREAEKKQNVMSAADRERRTKAEEMVEMFGSNSYPLQIYMAALERNGDDPQLAAAWLLEKGPDYLETLYQDLLNQSSLSTSRSTSTINRNDVVEDEDDDAFTERHAGRYLDDELDADVPVQVQEEQRRQQQRRRAQDVLKVEDIYLGMPLTVSRTAQLPDEMSQLAGRTGIVTRIDLENLRITLSFLNTEVASERTHVFNYKSLETPLTMFNHPYARFIGGSVIKLRNVYGTIETNLSTLKIRRSVLSLLLENEEFDFDMEALGAQNVLNILKLAASEFLYANYVTSRRRHSHALLDAFKKKLTNLLQKESEVPPQPLYASTKGIITTPSLTRKLTQEVIHHLQQAVEIPPPFLFEESAHNYAQRLDYRKKLRIPGASRLLISFQGRCQVATDTLTRVSFYLTDDYTRPLTSFSGTNFVDFVVNSDTIYFRFTSGLGKTYWGYKFKVIPLELRLNDIQALQGLNLELGHWLLDLLLEKGPKYVTDEYLSDLFNALMWYISSAKRAARTRGILLVLKLLQEMRKAPRHQQKRVLLAQKKPMAKLLKETEKLFMKESREVEEQDGSLMFSELLQYSLELVLHVLMITRRDLNIPDFFPPVEWFDGIFDVAVKATNLANGTGSGLIDYKIGDEEQEESMMDTFPTSEISSATTTTSPTSSATITTAGTSSATVTTTTNTSTTATPATSDIAPPSDIPAPARSELNSTDIAVLAASIAMSLQTVPAGGIKLKITYKSPHEESASEDENGDDEFEDTFSKDLQMGELVKQAAQKFGLKPEDVYIENALLRTSRDANSSPKYIHTSTETIGDTLKTSTVLVVKLLHEPEPVKPFVLPKLTAEEEVEMTKPWDLSLYAALNDLVSDLSLEKKADAIPNLIDFEIGKIVLPSSLDDRYPPLRGIPLAVLRRQFKALQDFNEKISSVIPLVDFRSVGEGWSVVTTLGKIREAIFFQVKMEEWDKIVTATSSNEGSTTISIDRPKAEKAREKGDPSGSRSFFGQAFRQLHFLSPNLLRTNNDYPWRVVYSGEEGADAGGLFRDCLTNICLDIQSTHLSLFFPCPNASGVGENQERWLPRPSAVSSLELSMFAFVGKLMGVAMRGQHTLNLDLPSLVWKQLVGDPILVSDIIAVDAIAFNVTDLISKLPIEHFEHVEYTFVVNTADGKTVDLKKDGSNIKVTYENKDEFIELWKQYKLNEFNVQVNAIKDGLAAIVPVQLLSLFTWRELELQVCGRREISVEYLRDNTVYNTPYNKNSEQVKWLFEVLDNFSQKEREGFLRFVWGRSRLPISSDLFSQKFQVTGCPHNEDGALPISHTCFFQLELPRYSKKELLAERLAFAISNCSTISLY